MLRCFEGCFSFARAAPSAAAPERPSPPKVEANGVKADGGIFGGGLKRGFLAEATSASQTRAKEAPALPDEREEPTREEPEKPEPWQATPTAHTRSGPPVKPGDEVRFRFASTAGMGEMTLIVGEKGFLDHSAEDTAAMLMELQGGSCRFEKGSDFREVQLLLHFPARDVGGVRVHVMTPGQGRPAEEGGKVVAVVNGVESSFTLGTAEASDELEAVVGPMRAGERVRAPVGTIELRAAEPAPPALRADPVTWAGVLKGRANEYLKKKRVARAREKWRTAVEFIDQNVEENGADEWTTGQSIKQACLLNMSLCAAQLDKFAGARDDAAAALALGNAGGLAAKAHYRLAQAYVGLGESSSATKSLRDLLALEPQSSQARTLLADCQRKVATEKKQQSSFYKSMLKGASDERTWDGRLVAPID